MAIISTFTYISEDTIRFLYHTLNTDSCKLNWQYHRQAVAKYLQMGHNYKPKSFRSSLENLGIWIESIRILRGLYLAIPIVYNNRFLDCIGFQFWIKKLWNNMRNWIFKKMNLIYSLIAYQQYQNFEFILPKSFDSFRIKKQYLIEPMSNQFMCIKFSFFTLGNVTGNILTSTLPIVVFL